MSGDEARQHLIGTINFVAIIINAVILLSIIIYHVYTSNKHNESGLNIRKSRLSLVLSFVLLFFGTWATCNLFIQFEFINSTAGCYYILVSGAGTYGFFKLTLYSILVYEFMVHLKIHRCNILPSN